MVNVVELESTSKYLNHIVWSFNVTEGISSFECFSAKCGCGVLTSFPAIYQLHKTCMQIFVL